MFCMSIVTGYFDQQASVFYQFHQAKISNYRLTETLVCVCVCVCVFIYVCMYVCMYVYVGRYVHVWGVLQDLYSNIPCFFISLNMFRDTFLHLHSQ